MEQRYYQKEIETMPLEDMKALQSERLVAQVKHVYENVPYYREKMDAAHVKPEDIHGVEDLHKLPFAGSVPIRTARKAAEGLRKNSVDLWHNWQKSGCILYPA